MATWEDGPEYAPIERPVDFGRPPVAQLDVSPPAAQQAAWAPTDRPVFSAPPAPVAPLATLVPVAKDPRDPQLPFDVASASITGDGAWGALHWSPPSGLPTDGPTGGLPAPDPYAPTTLNGTAPVSGPDSLMVPPPSAPWVGQQPMTLSPAQPPVGPSGYPAPGTPEWFTPGRYDPAPPTAPVTLSRVLQAATPGLCIVLVLGGLIYTLAPILLSVGLALSSRVTVAQQSVRRVFITAVSLLGLLAVGGAVNNEAGFADWWRFVGIWALVLCWLVLGTVLWLVRRDLQTPDVSPRRSTWG